MMSENWDSSSGLPCLLARLNDGSGVGFVGVPMGHPWYGWTTGRFPNVNPLSESDPPRGRVFLLTRAGIRFAGSSDAVERRLAIANGEDPASAVPGGALCDGCAGCQICWGKALAWWWFGFDCDRDTSVAFVREECEYIADQARIVGMM